MDIGDNMRFETWEEEAFNYLTNLYNDFFKELSLKSKECFRIDAKEIFSENVKSLTKKEENKIYEYWKKYTDDFQIDYHRYYIDRTGKFDERFIPDDLFVGYIDGYLNNRAIEPGVADKNYFDMYLKGFKMPKTYVHLINGILEDENYNIITKEKAIEILSKEKRITIKPSMASYGGKNVRILEDPTKEELEKLFDELKEDNLIFQEAVKQSKETAKLHPLSLNTIRIMTLILDGEVKVLPWCAFRMGQGKSKVDNASFGGIYCRINEDGTLSEFAYDALGNRFDKHPDGGSFSSVKFDFMDKVKDLVKEAAQRFPHFRLIGWDIAIDENDNPMIIEANLTMSGMDVIETIGGPLFGEYTDKVLEEVFLKKHKDKTSMDISQYV
jgi:hypothetical protein